MRTSDKLNPALRQAVQNGLDPSLRNLTVVAALPFLACILIVLHDSGVSFKLLRDLFMVFVISLVVAGGLSYFFMSREHDSEES